MCNRDANIVNNENPVNVSGLIYRDRNINSVAYCSIALYPGAAAKSAGWSPDIPIINFAVKPTINHWFNRKLFHIFLIATLP